LPESDNVSVTSVQEGLSTEDEEGTGSASEGENNEPLSDIDPPQPSAASPARNIRKSSRHKEQPKRLYYNGPGEQAAWSQPLVAPVPAPAVQSLSTDGMMALMQQQMSLTQQNAQMMQRFMAFTMPTL
jgi:hypothetical protein